MGTDQKYSLGSFPTALSLKCKFAAAKSKSASEWEQEGLSANTEKSRSEPGCEASSYIYFWNGGLLDK